MNFVSQNNLSIDIVSVIIKNLNFYKLLNIKSTSKEIKKIIEKEVDIRFQKFELNFRNENFLEKAKNYTIEKIGERKTANLYFCKLFYHIDNNEWDKVYYFLRYAKKKQEKIHEIAIWSFNIDNDKTLFHEICEKGLIYLVKYVINNTDEKKHSNIINSRIHHNLPFERPIHCAIKNNKLDILEFLLSNKRTDYLSLDSDLNSILDYAVKNKIDRVISYFIKLDIYKLYEIICCLGNIRILNLYENHFAKKLSKEEIEMGIFFAITYDKLKFLKKLVNKFNINLKKDICNRQIFKQNPLFIAIENESLKVIKYLINKKLYKNSLQTIIKKINKLNFKFEDNLIEKIVQNNIDSDEDMYNDIDYVEEYNYYCKNGFDI